MDPSLLDQEEGFQLEGGNRQRQQGGGGGGGGEVKQQDSQFIKHLGALTEPKQNGKAKTSDEDDDDNEKKKKKKKKKGDKAETRKTSGNLLKLGNAEVGDGRVSKANLERLKKKKQLLRQLEALEKDDSGREVVGTSSGEASSDEDNLLDDESSTSEDDDRKAKNKEDVGAKKQKAKKIKPASKTVAKPAVEKEAVGQKVKSKETSVEKDDEEKKRSFDKVATVGSEGGRKPKQAKVAEAKPQRVFSQEEATKLQKKIEQLKKVNKGLQAVVKEYSG